MRNLDLGALRSFATAVDAGGVTRAAERLRLTQSAVSMQIKRLEEAVGTRLLERAARGVSPTKEGEQLLGYARRMIALNDEAWSRLTAPGYEGEVAFGVPYDAIYPYVPRALAAFDRDFPRVRVRLVSGFTDQLKEALEHGAIDVILTTETGAQTGPEAETLRRTPLLWCGAHGGRAAFRDPLPYASARRCKFRPLALDALIAAGRTWEDAVDSDEEGVAVASASADLSVVAMISGSYAQHLAPVPPEAKLPALPEILINLYMGASPQPRIAQELARHVRDAHRD